MSTNKKAVVWNLDQFLRPDLTAKGNLLAKHFFNWEKEILGQNIYPCIYRLKFGIQRHRRFQHLAKPIDSRKFEVGQKRYGYAQLMRYASPNNHKWNMVSFFIDLLVIYTTKKTVRNRQEKLEGKGEAIFDNHLWYKVWKKNKKKQESRLGFAC